MALFAASMPVPRPDMDDAPFWEHARARRLCFQACAACGLPRHPPTPYCPRCHSGHISWVAAPSAARIYSFTVVRHAADPAVAGNLPYVVALVEFPDLPPVRLVTNLTDTDPARVAIGMPVMLWWDGLDPVDGQPAMNLPRFKPAAKAG